MLYIQPQLETVNTGIVYKRQQRQEFIQFLACQSYNYPKALLKSMNFIMSEDFEENIASKYCKHWVYIQIYLENYIETNPFCTEVLTAEFDSK